MVGVHVLYGRGTSITARKLRQVALNKSSMDHSFQSKMREQAHMCARLLESQQHVLHKNNRGKGTSEHNLSPVQYRPGVTSDRCAICEQPWNHNINTRFYSFLSANRMSPFVWKDS